jgi:hypothetical protein
VGNNVRPSRNLLLRQVVVPSWLQVVLMGTFIYVTIDLFSRNPVLAIIVAVGGLVLSAHVINPLRRRAGQTTDEEVEVEAKAAPTAEAAWSIRWRQLRTYQVWLLVVSIILAGGVLLESVGLVTLP